MQRMARENRPLVRREVMQRKLSFTTKSSMSTPDTGEYHVFALVTEIEQSKCSIYFMIFERVEDVFFDPKNTCSFMFLSIISGPFLCV